MIFKSLTIFALGIVDGQHPTREPIYTASKKVSVEARGLEVESISARQLSTTTSFIQLGQDIDGEAAGDRSGSSVALSTDGTVVAIGAPSNADNGSFSGHVRVFYKNNNNNWEQTGADIDGENLSGFIQINEAGTSVALSSDGTVLAIGAQGNNAKGILTGHVRVYNNNNNNWMQIGTDIDGKEALDNLGFSVALSSDGTIVATGAIEFRGSEFCSLKSFGAIPQGTTCTTKGYVQVHKNDNNNWVQMGNDIYGEAAGDHSGWSVALSSDGTIVAIGAPRHSGNGAGSGLVRVYEYNSVSESWAQTGSDIDGNAGDGLGRTVAMSDDGKKIAIGAPSGNSGRGYVRVFDYAGGSWVQLGSDIVGENANDASGWSVAMSSDGAIVAIGARQNDGNGSFSGHVRLYEYHSTSSAWSQVGTDIDGEAADDQSGTRVALSSDGTIVAIGAPQNEGNGVVSGHVRVYQAVPPTPAPSTAPSSSPSSLPSLSPTEQPTEVPSLEPSRSPSTTPSSSPSSSRPSFGPSFKPSWVPSSTPSRSPSLGPTSELSSSPSSEPSSDPSSEPSSEPSKVPSLGPTVQPSYASSSVPSSEPSTSPSSEPSSEPSWSPSLMPSVGPRNTPSLSFGPSSVPSDGPTLSFQPNSGTKSSKGRTKSSKSVPSPRRGKSGRGKSAKTKH